MECITVRTRKLTYRQNLQLKECVWDEIFDVTEQWPPADVRPGLVSIGAYRRLLLS
jgi:hypothetical protein